MHTLSLILTISFCLWGAWGGLVGAQLVPTLRLQRAARLSESDMSWWAKDLVATELQAREMRLNCRGTS